MAVIMPTILEMIISDWRVNTKRAAGCVTNRYGGGACVAPNSAANSTYYPESRRYKYYMQRTRDQRPIKRHLRVI